MVLFAHFLPPEDTPMVLYNTRNGRIRQYLQQNKQHITKASLTVESLSCMASWLAGLAHMVVLLIAQLRAMFVYSYGFSSTCIFAS